MSRSPLSQSKNWRTASKRPLGKFNNNNVGKTGAAAAVNSTSSSTTINGCNADHVKLLIDGLREKHDQMVAFLKSDLDDCKLEQEEVLSTGLMKLPKSIRKMSVKEFNQNHSCDLLSLLKSKDGVVLSSSQSSSSSGGTTADESSSAGDGSSINNNNKDATKKRCFETPANSRINFFGGRTKPGTILRTARRGEGIFSRNGSPLAATEPGTVIATINKKRRGNESANVEINVGEGQFISLNDPNGVSELDSAMKKTAASQLKVLQDQMSCLMAQLAGVNTK